MQLKDSLSNQKIELKEKDISIYACGITPYSSAHVGHARTYVFFDFLAKVLRLQGKSVRLVRNITDIDDKIINAAQLQGIQWHELSDKYAQENTNLMVQTGLQVPEQPKASDYLPEIFKLIKSLIDLDLAYVASNSDVLYKVSAYNGQLLMQHKEGSLLSEQGQSRVSSDEKLDSRDFALWKSMPKDAVGFDSPWGWGRPGWHIECSAMINALFGGSVTIHGGGVDLKFPHHQSEIMQSEPVNKKPLAQVWIHNGSVLSAGQKMSKSLGNFVLWQDALDQANAVAPGLGSDLLRYTMLQTHWQKPLDWSQYLLETNKIALFKIFKSIPKNIEGFVTQEGLSIVLKELENNFNTPGLFVWIQKQAQLKKFELIASAFSILGFDLQLWHKAANTVEISKEHLELIVLKERYRSEKNWSKADEVRALLPKQLASYTLDDIK